MAACSDDDDDTAGDSGPPLVTLDGLILNRQTQKAESGVTVAVPGASPAKTTKTDAKGQYSLQVEPGKSLFISANKSGFVESPDGLVVPAGGARGFTTILLPASIPDTLLTAAKMSKQSATKRMVNVKFLGYSKKGGESATLSASHGGSATMNSSQAPVKGSKLLAGGGDALFFSDVAVGSTKVTLSATTGTCALTYPTLTSYPVVAMAITHVHATCK